MLKVNRHAMPEQPADVRRHNFEEVALGYDEATAIEEAKRCLNCPKPRCVEGCPVNISQAPLRRRLPGKHLHSQICSRRIGRGFCLRH